MRARWQWLVGGCVFGLTAVVSVWLYQRHQAAAAPAEKAQPSKPPETELILAGRIRARSIVPIAAPIDGTLEGLEVIDGQEVFEGQLLARVRNSQLELAVEQAKLEVERLQSRVNSQDAQIISARLEASRAEADAARARAEFSLAEKNYVRQRMLLQEGATPRLTFEKVQKEYETTKTESEALSEISRQATAKVEIAVKNLEESRKLLADKNADFDDTQSEMVATEIHSPTNGLLLSHRASNGEEVKRDMKDLFQIAVNLTELELTAAVSAEQASRLRQGQPVIIQVVEAGNQSISGAVKSVSGSEVVVEFLAPDPAVKPGLTAQVRIPMDAISP